MKERIKQALEKATQGKWYVLATEVFVETGPIAKLWGEGINGEFRFDNYEHNGYLIANAPEWLRWQNEQLDNKDERIEQLEKAVERIESIVRSENFYWNKLDEIAEITASIGKEE